MKVHIVLAAGGLGQRFGASQKKQFLELGGQSLLDHCLNQFLQTPNLGEIKVVLPQDEVENFAFNDPRIQAVVGGGSRAESVRNGVMSLEGCAEDDIVLVHDAARPLVDQEIIQNVITGVQKSGCAIAAVPVVDTLKQVQDEAITGTVDRDVLRAAQTPQGSTWGRFQQAYAKLNQDLPRMTDEAMLFENSGFDVIFVAGKRQNLKVTTPEDLEIAKLFLKS